MQQVVRIGLMLQRHKPLMHHIQPQKVGFHQWIGVYLSQVPSSVGQRQIHPVGRLYHSQETVSCQRSLISTSHSKQTCPPLYGESRHLWEEDSPYSHCYCVGDGVIKPEQERLRPLPDYPPPPNVGSLRRVVGMFSYYAKWIPNFSDKVQPLVNAISFPLDESALLAFDLLKTELERATLQSIDEGQPFVVECEASEVCVSATLNQCGRPVAFMSRTLQGSELHCPPVEQEATAIIEAVHKWCHFLAGRHFSLVTCQRSVAFMIDNRKRSKMKNNKIQSWRLELASFSYTDSFTRAFIASMATSSLSEIHNVLGHRGVTRLLHFVSSKNMPFSTEDVKKSCSTCRICAELKQQFYRQTPGTLTTSTQPMGRPLPSTIMRRSIADVYVQHK